MNQSNKQKVLEETLKERSKNHDKADYVFKKYLAEHKIPVVSFEKNRYTPLSAGGEKPGADEV